jgi:hypothetical protein
VKEPPKEPKHLRGDEANGRRPIRAESSSKAGWLVHWNANFHPAPTPFEIFGAYDGPYTLCKECAAEMRAQLTQLSEEDKLPSA